MAMFQAREYMASLRQILGRAQSPSQESRGAKRKEVMPASSLGKEEELDAKDARFDDKEAVEPSHDCDMEISSVITGDTAPSNESGKSFSISAIFE